MNSEKELEEDLERRLVEANQLVELRESQGWKILERKFASLIASLDTIREVNFKDFGVEEGMARQLAIGILEQWWSDICVTGDGLKYLRKEVENVKESNKSEVYKFHTK